MDEPEAYDLLICLLKRLGSEFSSLSLSLRVNEKAKLSTRGGKR
jgi:hypothetical protein